jgi:hypothetical protein
MEIKLAGRVMPRGAGGDVKFLQLGEFLKPEERNPKGDLAPATILDVFTPAEVTELVNRAIYQLEYQAASHRKRGQRERDRMKALKQALKGDRTEIDKQLKGE